LHLPHNRLGDFKRDFKSAAKEFAMDPVDCAEWLFSHAQSDKKSKSRSWPFTSTIGETYFFRRSQILEVLETEILWDLVRRRRAENKSTCVCGVPVLHGEEPYSMAMVLRRLVTTSKTGTSKFWHRPQSPS